MQEEKPKNQPKEFKELPKAEQAKAILSTLAKYLNRTPEQIQKMKENEEKEKK